MPEQTTQEVLQVEYIDNSNLRRTTQLDLNVEYVDAANMRRTTQLLLMVEYADIPVIYYGPTWQMMG